MKEMNKLAIYVPEIKELGMNWYLTTDQAKKTQIEYKIFRLLCNNEEFVKDMNELEGLNADPIEFIRYMLGNRESVFQYSCDNANPNEMLFFNFSTISPLCASDEAYSQIIAKDFSPEYVCYFINLGMSLPIWKSKIEKRVLGKECQDAVLDSLDEAGNILLTEKAFALDLKYVLNKATREYDLYLKDQAKQEREANIEKMELYVRTLCNILENEDNGSVSDCYKFCALDYLLKGEISFPDYRSAIARILKKAKATGISAPRYLSRARTLMEGIEKQLAFKNHLETIQCVDENGVKYRADAKSMEVVNDYLLRNGIAISSGVGDKAYKRLVVGKNIESAYKNTDMFNPEEDPIQLEAE